MTQPIISWFDSTSTSEVTTPFDFGVIDAGDWGTAFTFNIWNNKGGTSDVSKMENCTITTRDMSGGLGDTVGSEVPVVRDSWFHAQIDSLGETDLSDVTSKIGKDFSKPIGTTGTTKHGASFTASTWVTATAYNVGDFVKPTVANNFIYKCTTAGTSGGTEPTWATSDGTTVNDSTVVWIAVAINRTPVAQNILGVRNDGTSVNSAGNFITVTLQAEIPLDASAGRQNYKTRISYQYV